MAKHSRTKLSPRLLIGVGGALIVAILAVQALFIWQLYVRTDNQQSQDIKAAIIDAVRNLNTELAVDPQTGRHYLPAYKVVLPAKLESHIYYRDGGEEASIWLTDAGNQNQAVSVVRAAGSLTETFKQVEALQKCSRQIVVSFNIPNPEGSGDTLTLKNTKQLKDGRTVYIYQNDCPYGAEPILRSLDQMESY